MKKFIMLAVVLAFGLSITALAQKKTVRTKASAKVAAAKAEVKFLAKGDGIESCAVSGEKLESKEIHAEFFGRTVYFCCKDCLATAQKKPAAYVKKTEAEQIAAVQAMAKHAEGHDHHKMEGKAEAAKFLGKGDGIESCPVTGEAIDKSVSFEIQGKTVYACCPGCIDKVKKNPELYLKWAKAEK